MFVKKKKKHYKVNILAFIADLSDSWSIFLLFFDLAPIAVVVLCFVGFLQVAEAWQRLWDAMIEAYGQW